MKLGLTILFISIITLCNAQDSPQGKWKTHEGDIVELSLENGNWIGKLLQSKDETSLGKTILRNFKEDGKKLKGEIYSPQASKFIEGILEIEDNVMEVTGKLGFISKSFTWNRVE